MSTKIPDKYFLYGLTLLPGLGPARLKLLLDHFPSAKSIWNLSESEVRSLKLPSDVTESLISERKKIDLAGKIDNLGERGIELVTLVDENYPSLLKEIYDPPPVLYVRGRLHPTSRKMAVVGARLMTVYGHQVTETLTRELSARGLTIVSGLARGVDALAHRTALSAGVETIAVLGSGLDQVYPPENIHLAEEIAEQGAVISEYSPETEASRGTFPARNRIISGLSLGVLVTEAGEDSGSLITANTALEQGRAVFSVPGPINSRQSAGTNNLIKIGAQPVSSIEDILEDLNLPAEVKASEMVEIRADNLTEKKILGALSLEPIHFDDLVRVTKLSAASLGSALTVMVISGKAADLGGNYYVRHH